jgi:predicted O-methyltransferase YrrM
MFDSCWQLNSALPACYGCDEAGDNLDAETMVMVSHSARPLTVLRSPHGLARSLDRLRYRAWFKGKEFTSDWTSGNFSLWRRVLSSLRHQPLRILEIGSWEGRSAIFFLNFFERSTMVCIDTFAGTAEEKNVYDSLASILPGVESRFDRNLAAFGHRVDKIKSRSGPALKMLQAEGRRFDLAYIDGGHRRDEVMADSVGVWQLLEPGGIVIWDDYKWGQGLPPEERPQPAIDAFLQAHEDSYRLLASGYQVMIERLR